MTLSNLKFHPLVFKWTQKNSKQFTFHITLHFFIYIIFIYIILHFSFFIGEQYTAKKFYSYCETLSNPITAYEVETLETYMDSSFLPKKEKGECASLLYPYYLSEANYEKGIEYIKEALYYYEQTKDSYAIAHANLSMAQAMNSMLAFNNAQHLLKEILNTQLPNIEETNLIKYYAYLTMADIYSQTNQIADALSSLEEAKTLNVNLSMIEKDYSILSIIVEARCYLYQNEYKQCLETLSLLPKDISVSSNPFLNTYIPYLDIQSKVLLQTNKIEEGFQKTEELISYCDSHHYENFKLQHLSDILILCYNNRIQYNRIADFETILAKEYPIILKQRTENMAVFMGYAFRNLTQNMNTLIYTKELKWKVFALVTIFLLLGLFLLILLKQSINKNRTDGLTNVFNRSHFNYIYDGILKNQIPFCIIMFDIDNFKSCNDVFGHEFGDEVLIKVAHTAKNVLPNGCNLFRYGGEEFCIICPHTSMKKTCQIAESIRSKIEALSWSKDTKITISLGIAENVEHKNPLSLSDERLYYSKHHGKNRFTYC